MCELDVRSFTLPYLYYSKGQRSNFITIIAKGMSPPNLQFKRQLSYQVRTLFHVLKVWSTEFQRLQFVYWRPFNILENRGFDTFKNTCATCLTIFPFEGEELRTILINLHKLWTPKEKKESSIVNLLTPSLYDCPFPISAFFTLTMMFSDSFYWTSSPCVKGSINSQCISLTWTWGQPVEVECKKQ